jgi:fructose-1-phosphate kinase PfkB-like protein
MTCPLRCFRGGPFVHTGPTALGDAMKDMQARLEKVRADASEWALLSGSAPDEMARELFAKLAACLTELADEVERVLGATRH